MPALFLSNASLPPSDCSGHQRDELLHQLLSKRMETEWLRADDCAGEPLWRRALGALRPEALRGYSSDVARRLREKAQPGRLLWISRLEMAQYVPLARKLGYRIILDEQNVVSETLVNGALSNWKGVPGILKALQCAYHERNFCQQAHALV